MKLDLTTISYKIDPDTRQPLHTYIHLDAKIRAALKKKCGSPTISGTEERVREKKIVDSSTNIRDFPSIKKKKKKKTQHTRHY